MYFERENIRDQLLKGVLKEEDVNESTEYIDNLAMRLGVQKSEIPNPVSYPIQKLAMYYALMICAENQSTMNKNGEEPGDDSYEKKRAVYAGRVRELEREITKETFVGPNTSSAGAFMMFDVRLERR